MRASHKPVAVFFTHRLNFMPKRIQRKRTKGWRMPQGAVFVGPPTVYRSPFNETPEGLQLYLDWICGHFPWVDPERRQDVVERLPDLAGKDLACNCPEGNPCAADVLLKLVNSDLLNRVA